MKFSVLETSVKKQVKASMKRIAQKFIKLNSNKTEPTDYKTAFNIWSSRYLSIHENNKYYNLVNVDEELFLDFQKTMEEICSREEASSQSEQPIKELNYPKYYIEKPATEKQLNYARYLMNMINNEPLPRKKYTMYEMNVLINSLKGKLKSL